MKPKILVITAIVSVLAGIWTAAYIWNGTDLAEWIRVCCITSVIIIDFPWLAYLASEFDSSLH